MEKITFEYMDYAGDTRKNLVVDFYEDNSVRIDGKFVETQSHNRRVFFGKDALKVWKMLEELMNKVNEA